MRSHPNYEVFEEIGRSGHTVVYAGYNQMTKRNVAIKEVADPNDPEQMRLLQDTTRFLAELPDYTHVLDVKDLITENGWLVLDRMRESLADHVAREKRGMPPDQVRSVLRQALKGLAVLHKAGRWVGNVRPSNLLINDDGQVRLGDSPGLVSDGVVRPPDSKPKYLAPERIDGAFGEVGPWTDLYTLGFTALELLKGPKFDELFTGTGPDAIDPNMGWLRVHGSKSEKFPLAAEVVKGLPTDLSRVIDRLLEKDVKKRYPSAEAALADLGAGETAIPEAGATPAKAGTAEVRALKGPDPGPVGATATPRPPSADPDEEAKRKKRMTVYAAGGGLLVVLLAVGAAALMSGDDAPKVAEVTIETTPTGAKLTDRESNKQSKVLTPGPYKMARDKPRKFRLELDGHEPYDLDVDPASKTKYAVALKPVGKAAEDPPAPEVKQVTINTTPAGAKLTWVTAGAPSSTEAGRTPGPFAVTVRPEPQKARLELDGYQPLELDIDPATKTTYEVALVPAPRPMTPTVAVKIVTKPEAACDVVIDGKPAGQTPLDVGLAPGKRIVGVTPPGKPPIVRDLTVTRPGETFVFDLSPAKEKDKDDPQLPLDVAAADNWVRRSKPLLAFLEREATPEKFERWLKGSTRNDPAGDVLVAHCKLEGVAGPKDEPGAVRLYRKAADAGSVPAAYWLGLAYATGTGVEKDEKKAVELYMKAAAAKHPPATYAMGLMTLLGRGLPKDEAAAVDWFRRAVNLGHAAGSHNLAVITERGMYGVAKDDAAARKLYEQAAKDEYPASLNNLGLMCQAGRGGEKDDARAGELFRRSAELGNPEGMFNAGEVFRQSPLPDDQAKAVEWYQKAVAAKYVRAMSMLGAMHEKGLGGLAKDDAKAAALYKQAAEGGHTLGMANFGIFLMNGRGGVEKDEKTALEWFKKAADPKLEYPHPLAMTYLGVFYQQGKGGLEADERLAHDWFKKAADVGEDSAMVKLGVMLQKGMGRVEKNPAAAAAWYRKAAERKNPDGMYNLALMLEVGGDGIKQDKAEAARLLQEAAALGHAAAIERLAKAKKP